MQENEFEKQVQQKMEELKLVPSDAVWQKIEPQIKKEKRRRWILILFPLVIGLLYGGYQLIKTDRTVTQPQISIAKNADGNNSSTKQANAVSVPVKDNSPGKGIQAPAEKEKNIKETHQRSNLQWTKFNGPYHTIHLTKNITGKYSNKETIVEKEKLNINIKDPGQEKIDDKENIAENKIPKPAEFAKQETIPATDSAGTKNEKLIKQETATEIEAKKITKKRSRWNWGLSFAAGISGTKGVTGITDAIFRAEDRSSNFVSSVTGPGYISNLPSSIRSSLAFAIGISAEKKLLPKLFFTTGLNYKLLSTVNSVGTDSFGVYYSYGNSMVHHNYFHYFELPAGFKLQLTNGKIPVYWNGASTIAVLAASNSLQYSSSAYIYYHDNSLLNKIQFGFSTGFDLDLNSKQRTPLFIGPFFNYTVSKIADQGYNSHHFTFIGLRAQYFFSRK